MVVQELMMKKDYGKMKILTDKQHMTVTNADIRRRTTFDQRFETPSQTTIAPTTLMPALLLVATIHTLPFPNKVKETATNRLLKLDAKLAKII